jgi:hypothetical protein
MRLDQFVVEANVAAKIKDPGMIKRIAIAWRHDSTLPPNMLSKLGPRATDDQIVKAWSEVLDKTLSDTDYGDLSRDGKFDDWLTRMYADGRAEYEDINGEGGDALGAWKQLSIRSLLAPADQDLNRFSNLKQIQRIVRKPEYRQALEKIKNAEKLEKIKRDAKSITVLDNDKYQVTIPLNFGACYMFNNGVGHNSNFCTGSSSGTDWYPRYAKDGIMIDVLDKANADNEDGKWQLHAVTNQIVNSIQDRRHDRNYNDEKFAKLFPGLLKQIGDAIMQQAEAVKQGTKHDAAHEVQLLQQKFPQAWNSAPPEPEGEPEAGAEDGPGTWLVTMRSNGRTARIPGDSREHVLQQIMARHPNIDPNDLEFRREGEGVAQ